MKQDIGCWQNNSDFAVIWTQPQGVIESFNYVLNYQHVSIDKIFKEVDEYSSILMNVKDRVNFVFVPTWVFPTYHRGFGALDMKGNVGIANTLMRMNLRLSENLDKTSNIYLLNTQKWIETAGKNAFDPSYGIWGRLLSGMRCLKKR